MRPPRPVASAARLAALCLATLHAAAVARAPAPAPALPDPAPVSADAAPPTPPQRGEALFMADYQVISVPGAASLDLAGIHLLNRMNDWLYVGVGVAAPLAKGEYGGFMAVDVTAHARRRLTGRVFADAGLSLGGGGGGNSVQQSRVLSGTGGFVRAYAGLGADFGDFSVGAHVSRIAFRRSSIDDTGLKLFVQVPFSYAAGPYAAAGSRVGGEGLSGGSMGEGGATGETMLTLGLDHLRQIDPRGSHQGSIQVADLQVAHFLSPQVYWHIDVGVGVKGLPLYNQVMAGLGVRVPLSERLRLHAQLGVGSGGYAPSLIDTGPGLLVQPKVSAELMLGRKLGLSVTTSALVAPKASSRNVTVGLALNYHLGASGTGTGRSGGPADPTGPGESDGGERWQGWQLHLFQQTQFDLRSRGLARDRLQLVTAQLDHRLSDHLYLPVQVGAAWSAYLGYPGYGELLAGLGLQTRPGPQRRVQLFAHLLAGANVHGPILKSALGLNLALSDRLALHGVVGQTASFDAARYRSNYVGLGVGWRFSVPGA